MKIAVIGGGIVGASAAFEAGVIGGHEVHIYEKENALGKHQSGHNSGVVHAGLYYTPGSLKARLCRRGVVKLRSFAKEHGVTYDESGKLIVAQTVSQVHQLRNIQKTARANDVPGVDWLSEREISEIEPNVSGLAALRSSQTAIVDFRGITRGLAAEVARRGGQLRTSRSVDRVITGPDSAQVQSLGESESYDRVIVCAGLQSDRIAEASGASKYPLIVPFYGSYYKLNASDSKLVKHAIYPVPDPRYPFLGVHITPRLDGSFMLGPSAYLSTSREGYSSGFINSKDIRSMTGSAGFWKMALANATQAIKLFPDVVGPGNLIRGAKKLVPTMSGHELVRLERGVRAQAVNANGQLEDDFVLEQVGRVTFLRNAPSPGATSAMALGEELVKMALIDGRN